MAYKNKEKQKLFQREWKRKCNLKNKLKAVEILGGKCSYSGCNVTDFRCLHIDHITPKMGGTNSGSGINNSNMVVRGSLTSNEVQLLCANHHAIKTYEQDRYLFKNYIDNKASSSNG